MCKSGQIQPYLSHEMRRKHNKKIKKIQADLENKVAVKLLNYARRLFRQL
jgi:hypothetical protein